MSPDDPLYAILDYILNRATTGELAAIGEALKRRQQPKKGLGGISPRGMAETVAKTVRTQLGGMLDVHQVARKIVADLIRDKEPNIGERELAVLLDSWLPEPGKRAKNAPPDVMLTMVSHYVSAHNGSLSAEQLKQLPQGWQSRYWEAFSPDLRALIEAFLAGRIGEVDFWSRVIAGVGE
jgi:hypothetical protein